MRKLYAFEMTSVDGYHETPDRQIDWHNVDQEFNEFAIRQLDETEELLFGRVTYELMAGYWPTAAAIEDDPEVATRMNEHPKIVVSGTLDRVDWANTRLIRGDLKGELTRLKERPGKDIAIVGSSSLAASLLEMGLVDELRLMVAPVLLGSGRSVFESGASARNQLKLLETRPFASGNVLLTYKPLPTGE